MDFEKLAIISTILLLIYQLFIIFNFYSEAQILVNICNALAIGLSNSWVPQEQVKTLAIPGVVAPTDQSSFSKSPTRKTGKSTNGPPQPTVTITKNFALPSEASSDFKKALDVSIKIS
jgi:hypothetical protein